MEPLLHQFSRAGVLSRRGARCDCLKPEINKRLALSIVDCDGRNSRIVFGDGAEANRVAKRARNEKRPPAETSATGVNLLVPAVRSK
jgi:hypothetical protein